MISILNELKVPRSKGILILSYLTRYSAGIISSSELSVLCDPYLGRDKIKMLRVASVEKYSLFRLKLYCVSRANGGGKLSDYSLPTICAEVYAHLSTEDIKELRAMKTLSMSAVNKKQDSLCNELTSYISKFVYRKLRFIATGNNMSLQDIKNELLCRAVQVFYMSAPQCTSSLHLLNKMKQGIHNQGMNLITYYTSKKRARCVQDGEQYTNTVVSEVMVDTTDAPNKAYDSWETSLSISHYLDSLPRKKRVFIEILQGENEDFDRKEPHFMLKSFDNKIKTMADYLGVSVGAARKFMEQLKQDLEVVC